MHHDAAADAAAVAADAAADVDAWHRASEARACDSPKDYHYLRSRSRSLRLLLVLHLVLLLLLMEAEEAEDLETGHWRVDDGGGDVACADAGGVACDAVEAAVVGDFVPVVPSGWRREAKGVAAAAGDSGSDFASDLNAAEAQVDSALGDAWQQPQPSL
jgi:hypothetical protein